MQVLAYELRDRPLSALKPAIPPEPEPLPPIGGKNGGERLPVLALNIEIGKSNKANVTLWVPALAVLGPQTPPWTEEWAAFRLGQKFILPDVTPPPAAAKRRLGDPEPAEGEPESEAWVTRTQLARATGYKEPWAHPKILAMRKIITTVISVVSGIQEDELVAAKVSGTHAGRHTLTEVVAHLMWDDKTPDVGCLGEWALPKPADETGGGNPSRNHLRRKASTPASVVPGVVPGASRPSASTRHYQAQYNEREQLSIRVRAMGALRISMANFVAEGGELETTTGWDEIIPTPRDAPPEMHQYYGPAGAPMFGPPGDPSFAGASTGPARLGFPPQDPRLFHRYRYRYR
jgi:hypothetical protein